MDLVDVHGRLLSGADPCRASVARAVRDGLTLDELRPRSDAGRERRSGGEEDADRPRVIRWGIDCWGSCYEGSGCPTTLSQARALEKDAACPGCVASALGEAARGEAAGPRCDRRPTHDRRRSSAQGEQRPWGKLRDVKRPACSERQTGACRSCGLAVSQPCRGHEEPVGAQDLSATSRRTPTDLWRTKHGARSVPDVQRKKRSTPTARLVPNGRSDQPRPSGGCPATEAINSNR